MKKSIKILIPIVVILSLIIMGTDTVQEEERWIAGFAPVVIEDYTEVIFGTTITVYPPPAGPYYEEVSVTPTGLIFLLLVALSLIIIEVKRK